ncbi:DUF6223 family protein [Streptomyces roseolus]|uniref:DUF6223 family protein n=1 Tax=Streptomyces roseolus TaxID=67358 RepID=UPI0037946260
MAAGPVVVVPGAVVAATADGGPGTGNGLGGAHAALVFGLAATALGCPGPRPCPPQRLTAPAGARL